MSRIFISFTTISLSIQNESFSGRNYMNTAAFRQNTETKFKKLQTIIIKAGDSSNTMHRK